MLLRKEFQYYSIDVSSPHSDQLLRLLAHRLRTLLNEFSCSLVIQKHFYKADHPLKKDAVFFGSS
jgi:hypothetical protein